MSIATISIVAAAIAHSVAVLIAFVKLIVWVSSKSAITDQRLNALEHQVDNDVTGRRVVAEMREDIAAIKAKLADIRDHLKFQNH